MLGDFICSSDDGYKVFARNIMSYYLYICMFMCNKNETVFSIYVVIHSQFK